MTAIGELGVVGRRACAALAVSSACLHTVMLGHAPNVVVAGILATMIAACLYCARELWRDGTDRAWVVVALMNLAMIALHLPAPSHHHVVATASALPQPTVMAVATLLAFVEVLAATAALCVRTRGRMVQLSGTPDR
jgi:hypothetical protein